MKLMHPHTRFAALSSSLLALSSISSLQGGEFDYVEAPLDSAVPAAAPDAFQWLTPSIDIRARFEYRDQDGLDPSTSVTGRARLGLTLGDFGGFSGFVEGEFTGVANNDFRSNPATSPSTFPNVAGNTVIADPSNAELNRAWVQFKKNGFLAKVGRQRIIRNDAFFIGNVGWRQNEQTFDAAQIGFSNDDFNVSYVYSDRAIRIFGQGAAGALGEFTGDFHFIDLDFKTELGKVGGYAYLIDVDNNGNVGESNTFGAFANLGPVYLEAAYQEGTSNLAGGDYDSLAARAKYTLKTDAGDFSAGIDWTEDDFKTPFQPAHAPFGYADAFLLQQVGLNKANGFDGIFNAHLKYTKKGLPGGLVFKGALHYFANEDLSESYGYEADMVLVKKFNDNLTGLLKAAYFVGDGSSTFPDIRQVTVDLGYKF